MSQLLKAGSTIAAVTAGVVVMSLVAVAPAGASPRDDGTPVVTVVASGLNSPKQITLGPGGLYVAESGTGGSSCVTVEGTAECEGETGAVALVTPFGTRNLLSGLPSVLDGTQGAGGPAAVTFDNGKLAVLFQDAAVNPDGSTAVQGPGADAFGKLLLAWPFSGPSGWTLGSDIAAFAAANPENPATMGGIPGTETAYDSDPYDIVSYHGGYAIADAAANDVLWLSPKGHLSILDRLPTVPMAFNGTTIDAQAVPTSLAVGPHGALYVGTFSGFPNLPGTARIYRLTPGQPPAEVASRLTAVTAIAFDHKGRLLALEYSTGGLLSPPGTPGALVRVDLTTGINTTLPVTSLQQPAGLAVGRRDTIYIANYGNSTGKGEILKITGLG
jgi:hypothetical protein